MRLKGAASAVLTLLLGCASAARAADDWKWSVNAEKTFAGHIQISGQIANDHLVVRPARPGLLNESGGMSEVLSSTKDWYFMFRIGYFF